MKETDRRQVEKQGSETGLVGKWGGSTKRSRVPGRANVVDLRLESRGLSRAGSARGHAQQGSCTQLRNTTEEQKPPSPHAQRTMPLACDNWRSSAPTRAAEVSVPLLLAAARAQSATLARWRREGNTSTQRCRACRQQARQMRGLVVQVAQTGTDVDAPCRACALRDGPEHCRRSEGPSHQGRSGQEGGAMAGLLPFPPHPSPAALPLPPTHPLSHPPSPPTHLLGPCAARRRRHRRVPLGRKVPAR